MPNPKARKLSDLIPHYAPEGRNDGRWFLLEHQLYQVRVSLTQARQIAEFVGNNPENEEERELASAALEILTPVYVKFLEAHAATRSLLAGTEVAERTGGKEL